MNNNITRYNYLNSFNYISKLPVFKSGDIPALKSATVSLRLRVVSEYDIRIPHALMFSEWVTGQRGFVKSIKFIYKYNKPIIQVQVSTTLRHKVLLNFFEYLVTCYFGILQQRLNSVKVSQFSQGFNFFIKDINFFYNIPNVLYNFNEFVEVRFFTKKNFNIRLLELFISSYPPIKKYLKRTKSL